MAITTASSSSTWHIRSELSDRVRVFHPGLSSSPGLRRHCGSLLHRTHWLLSHRINAISSTVVIRFNPSQKNELTLLLERCFVEPFADSSLEQVLSEESFVTDIVAGQDIYEIFYPNPFHATPNVSMVIESDRINYGYFISGINTDSYNIVFASNIDKDCKIHTHAVR